MMPITKILLPETGYPEGLRHVVKPPETLFMRGTLLPADEEGVAIVGSRKCSTYGKQVAYDFAYGLAQAGVTIISGMAFGVDGEAHRGALDAGGRTIAVLGTGVDTPSLYPAAHKGLAERIEKSGALISEFPVGTQALPHHFPQRNRMIAGLAQCVVVIEAGIHSGSLITAGFALEQGKEVCAVPGSIYASTSVGTHTLIRQGAHLVTSATDVLLLIGKEIIKQNSTPSSGTEKMSPTEEIILTCIEKGPREIDALIAEIAVPAHEILSLLPLLELKNKIQYIGNNTYVIKK